MILALKNCIYLLVLFGAGYVVATWGAGRELRRLMGPRYAAAYAITIAAGFFAPNIWLYHLIVMATFIATVRDREDAICRYAVMIGLLPSLSTLITIGPVYLGTYLSTPPLSIAMLIAGVIKPVRGPKMRPARGWRVEDALVAVLFFVFGIAATHSGNATTFLRNGLMVGFEFVLPFFLFRRHVTSAEQLRRVVGCLAFSAVSIALIAVYESRTSWPLYDGIVSRLSMTYGLAAATSQRGGSLRAMASFTGPLGLAYFMVLALLAWLCSRRMFVKPLLWKGGIALIALAIMAPKSRGNLVALVPALMVLLAARKRYAAAALVLAGAGVGGAALYLLQHSSATIAMYVGGARTGDYYDYRGLLLHRGLEEGMRHWLTGQSYMNVVASLVDITQGEHIVDLVNSYLQIFLFSGVLGFVPFMVLMLLSLRKLVARAPRGTSLDAMRDGRAFLLAALIGTYVYIWGVSFGDRTVPYMMMMLAMARLCSGLLVRERRALPQPSRLPVDRQLADENLLPA